VWQYRTTRGKPHYSTDSRYVLSHRELYTCADNLEIGEVVTTIPTIGFNVESVTYKNLNFNVWVGLTHPDNRGCSEILTCIRIWEDKLQSDHIGDVIMPILLPLYS